MKAGLVTSLCLCLLLSASGAKASVPQDEVTSSEWRAMVKSEKAALYSGVSTKSGVVAQLSRGDALRITLEITTAAGKWYSVVGLQNSIAGYMDGKDLGVEEPVVVASWEFKPPPEPADPSDADAEKKAAEAVAASRAKIERDIKSFFVSKFGSTMPISAFGQTGLHNRFGFDHRNAVDVALNPDSPEGRRLVTQLRTLQVPFLTFRKAIPGIATGAHIHVGKPSHRK